MAYTLANRHAIEPFGVDIAATYASGVDAPHEVGTRAFGVAACEWVFCSAGEALTGDGYVCAVDDDFEATLADNSSLAGQIVGVPQAAIASGDRFWLQVQGPCNIRSAANNSVAAAQATTSTGGQIDDAAGAGTKNIHGLFVTTAPGGSAATVRGKLFNAHVTTTN